MNAKFKIILLVILIEQVHPVVFLHTANSSCQIYPEAMGEWVETVSRFKPASRLLSQPLILQHVDTDGGYECNLSFQTLKQIIPTSISVFLPAESPGSVRRTARSSPRRSPGSQKPPVSRLYLFILHGK